MALRYALYVNASHVHSALLKVGVTATIGRERGKDWTSGARVMIPSVTRQSPRIMEVLRKSRSASGLTTHLSICAKVRTLWNSQDVQLHALPPPLFYALLCRLIRAP